jgi:hypothetical protein
VNAGGNTSELPATSAYWTVKMEAIYSSETLVDFQRSTRRYMPEDSTLGICTLGKLTARTSVAFKNA